MLIKANLCNICTTHFVNMLLLCLFIEHYKVHMNKKIFLVKKPPKRYDGGGKTLQLAGSFLQILNYLSLDCIHCWPEKFLSRIYLDVNSA